MCFKVSTLALCCVLVVLASLVHESTAGKKGHKIIVTSGGKKGCGCHKVPVHIPVPIPVPVHHGHGHGHGHGGGGGGGGGFSRRMDPNYQASASNTNYQAVSDGYHHPHPYNAYGGYPGYSGGYGGGYGNGFLYKKKK